MNEPTLFDQDQRVGAVLRDAALAQVEAHADPDWKDLAALAIRSVASSGEAFTTDDVWKAIDMLTVETTHEPRALGALMRNAARAGLIRPTERYRQSVRPECHCRPVRVWEATR